MASTLNPQENAFAFYNDLIHHHRVNVPIGEQCFCCNIAYGRTCHGITEFAIELECGHVMGSNCMAKFLQPVWNPRNKCPRCEYRLFSLEGKVLVNGILAEECETHDRMSNEDKEFSDEDDGDDYSSDEDEDEDDDALEIDGINVDEFGMNEDFLPITRMLLLPNLETHHVALRDVVAREHHLYQQLGQAGADLPPWNHTLDDDRRLYAPEREHHLYQQLAQAGADLPPWNHTLDDDHRLYAPEREPFFLELERRGAFNIERLQGVRIKQWIIDDNQLTDHDTCVLTDRQLFYLLAIDGYVWAPATVHGDEIRSSGWSLDIEGRLGGFLATLDPKDGQERGEAFSFPSDFLAGLSDTPREIRDEDDMDVDMSD